MSTQLKNDKIIRDPVHGYIGLTKLEYELIQLPVLNRLHNVRQMAIAYLVYPGALTTRFVHCVGVMHVASKMIRNLHENSSAEIFATLFPDFKGTGFSRLEQTVRLAALLHDVGHGPFSHVSEQVMEKCLTEAEKTQAAKIFQDKDFHAHEYCSIKLIQHEIGGLLAEEDSGYVANVCALIAKESFSSELGESVDGLTIARQLISGQLDADRMDYLLRDAYATGVTYGSIDADRILLNLMIRKDKTDRFHIAVHERALSAIEDMLDARFKMYKWVYRHHLVVSVSELLRKALDDFVPRRMSKNLFRWEVFEQGGGDDHSVWTELRKVIKREPTAAKYNGILDRRFLPISLFKRPAHLARLVDRVIEKTGRHESEENIRHRIERLIIEPELQDTLRQNIERERAPLSKATLFGVNLPPSPYKPIKHDDTIWLCGDETTITELTEESTYSQAISREWGEFPSAVFCYVIPNMKRDNAKGLADRMEEVLVSTLAGIR